jgi:hypothetical protein
MAFCICGSSSFRLVSLRLNHTTGNCDRDADNGVVFGGIYRFDATQQARK